MLITLKRRRRGEATSSQQESETTPENKPSEFSRGTLVRSGYYLAGAILLYLLSVATGTERYMPPFFIGICLVYIAILIIRLETETKR